MTIPRLLLSIFQFIFILQLSAQNRAIDYRLKQDSFNSYAYLYLDNGDSIQLKTYDKTAELKCVDYYADDAYCMILLEHSSRGYSSYLVLAAYEYNGRWLQDYTMGSIMKLHTGISCSHIHHLCIFDGETLYIEYQVFSEFADYEYYFKSDIKLGKYSFHEIQTKQSYGLTLAGKGSDLEEAQKLSSRPNLSKIEVQY